MQFSGIQRTSLIDFPNRISTVLFTPNCNLRCPFCHNWRIVLDPKPPFFTDEMVIPILEKRRKYVDALVVTGGEPTMHSELPIFLKEIKKRGFSIKLDTNGFFSKIFEECLPYVDYVALDVKTSMEKYRLLGAEDTTELLRTIKTLKTGAVEYECRATVVPGFVDLNDVLKMGEIAAGCKRFVFQQFIPGDTLDQRFNEVRPYSLEVIESYIKVMKQYVTEVFFRY
ncbi:MAG: anaerobic ribonucleoside-triphosphate reductase activating protein [Candidatus Bathyarchaeota archaeon]